MDLYIDVATACTSVIGCDMRRWLIRQRGMIYLVMLHEAVEFDLFISVTLFL